MGSLYNERTTAKKIAQAVLEGFAGPYYCLPHGGHVARARVVETAEKVVQRLLDQNGDRGSVLVPSGPHEPPPIHAGLKLPELQSPLERYGSD